jgi:hypothetical protein
MASIIVIAAVLVLDVLAFVLAIGAERRRSYVRDGSSSQLHQSVCFDRSTHLPARPVLQVNYVSVDPAGGSYCVYSSDASTAYGVSALLLLRPRALAGPLAGVVRHLLHRLLVTLLIYYLVVK